MSEKILFVDDEPNVLQSVKRQLHKRFFLQIAESGKEALRIMRDEGPFAVIVSDMRMPQMNGVELLSRIKDLYPETVRLMLTGNADQETAMEAVNAGQIFRFLTKPCPTATLVTALALALRQYRLITAEKELLQKTLKGCVNILTEHLAVANPLAFSSGLRVKEYMVSIAESLHLSNLWQYEMAALLSQIGCITLPGNVLSKVYAGHALTQDEADMYKKHPLVGASLLENIPRLEKVAKMIELQLTRFDEYDDVLIGSQVEEVLAGAQILKVVNDFDKRLFRGEDRKEALIGMRKQKGAYKSEILEILERIKAKKIGGILNLKVSQVSEGMIAAEDILAKNDVLIIPKGQTITKSLLHGLGNFSKQVGVVEPIRVRIEQGEDNA